MLFTHPAIRNFYTSFQNYGQEQKTKKNTTRN